MRTTRYAAGQKVWLPETKQNVILLHIKGSAIIKMKVLNSFSLMMLLLEWFFSEATIHLNILIHSKMHPECNQHLSNIPL